MILVNNRDKIPWQPEMTVQTLLEACRYTSPHIHVFVNGQLVRPPAYETHPIEDGDEVELHRYHKLSEDLKERWQKFKEKFRRHKDEDEEEEK